jgi:Lipase maturation factor
MMHELSGYWHSRWLFERGLAIMYLVAFLVTLNQFLPLAGERGLTPAARFLREVPFRYTPSIFHWTASDGAFRACAWVGIALSLVALSGIAARGGALTTAAVWAGLYVLYLSFVNAGQTWYGFGWESLLVEIGFFTMFAGASVTPPHALLNWIYRWTLFRLMFGAGLIKIRGDACWRDLTCLDYFFETQPMPNPLSWYFHHLPTRVLHGGVAFNHFVELIVPFGFFLPQPYAGIAGIFTIVFQLVLIAGGNLSWLNWITVVLAITTLDDRFLSWLPISPPTLQPIPNAQKIATAGLAVVVGLLSVAPTLNMLSPGQVMNTSFNPLQIVNTYGAFGSVTKERYEIVIEGTSDETITASTVWKEYEFKGKPGELTHAPPQVAPYHMRLDWLMWFAAMSSAQDYPWFPQLLLKLLEGDRNVLGLLDSNPFPDRPPHWIRAQLYLYRFTSPEERRSTGRWWNRQEVAPYFPAVRLQPRAEKK